MAEHGAVPKGHLPGAEMLSGHVREMPGLWRRICRQRRSEARVLPLPQQAGQGVWVPLGAGGQMAHGPPNPTRAFSNHL